ncbi:MAG: endonuclease/exonuclease/phosphatase family protein [Halobacteriovoraceae bacterium]|nr:endonuclease/exonuclease/phosphatase family protein [Halobacteriovoraceae bacterium]
MANTRIMTANIRFDSPQDKHQPWGARKDVLAKIIKKSNPDILGTQEGRRPQLLELENLISPQLSLIESHRDWIEQRMYPCLFYDKKKYHLIQSGDIWLSEKPYVPGSISFGSAFPRLCTWARLNDISDEKTLTVINTHLDHILTPIRSKQIEVLLREISNIIESNDLIILLGDFNEAPGGKVYNLVMNAGYKFVDPWKILNKEEETSYHKFKGKFEQGARIDWIFTSDEVQFESIDMIKTSENDIYPSDHFPILLTLS